MQVWKHPWKTNHQHFFPLELRNKVNLLTCNHSQKKSKIFTVVWSGSWPSLAVIPPSGWISTPHQKRKPSKLLKLQRTPVPYKDTSFLRERLHCGFPSPPRKGNPAAPPLRGPPGCPSAPRPGEAGSCCAQAARGGRGTTCLSMRHSR